LNKRAKRALELRQKGLSFSKIGQELGIGSERARQIVREYEAYLESLGDPLKRKIEELSRPGEAKRILNALRVSSLYDGDPSFRVYCVLREYNIAGYTQQSCYENNIAQKDKEEI
jgi:hypothetical protein